MLESLEMSLSDDPLSIGPIESEIMEVVWRIRKGTGRQVSRVMRRRLPYTTLMSAMLRLVEKGVLKREKRGLAFQYEPCFNREELPREQIRRILSLLLNGSESTRNTLYSSLLDTCCCDAATLDELQSKIDRRRAGIGR